MKVAFVFPGFEALGIEALSASLKRAGHETRLFFDPRLFNDTFILNERMAKYFDQRAAIIRRLVEWKPDVVAFSVVSDVYPWASEMAARIKKVMPTPIIMGGIHCSSVPDQVVLNPNVDCVVQGEGDGAILDVVSRIQNGEPFDGVPNVWHMKNGEIKHSPPRPLIRNLDSLPFADKSLYDDTFVKGLGIYTIMASRGCPHSCTYCNAGLLREIYTTENRATFWRARSPANVIEELKRAEVESRIDLVNFFDEVFGADIRWLREFAPLYRREIGKPFLSCAHPAHSTEEYVALLKEAGCLKVDLGIQSTDPAIRKNILNRHETNEQIGRAIENFTKAGIFLHVENIFNLPGQNEQNTIEMVRFYNRHRPDFIKIFGLRVYPRTPIEGIAMGMGLISPEDAEKNAKGEGENVKSLFLGGTMPNRDLFKFHFFFALIPTLPEKWIDYLLDSGAYKRFPEKAIFVNLLSRFFSRQNWKDDPTKRSFARRYIHHGLDRIRGAISK